MIQDGKKIAFLFLTRKELKQANVWKTLIQESQYKENFTFYVHSTEPLNDEYFQNFRIKTIVPTTWSRHILAWQALLAEALSDENNE